MDGSVISTVVILTTRKATESIGGAMPAENFTIGLAVKEHRSQNISNLEYPVWYTVSSYQPDGFGLTIKFNCPIINS